MKQQNMKRTGKIIAAVAAVLLVLAILGAVIFPNPYGPDIRRITSLIRGGVVIAALLIVVLFIYRARVNKRVKKIGTVLLTLALVLVTGINILAASFHALADLMLDRNTLTAEDIPELTDAARELTGLIEAEGLVLLRNEDDTLPLKSDTVNVFGYSSASIVYGGAGSGSADETDNIDLKTALEEAGFEVNEELVQFYEEQGVEKESGSVLDMLGGDYNIPEPAVSEYGDLITTAQEFSDNAVLVFSRNGGEGADMPMDMEEYEGGTAGRHYLQLAEAEEALVEMAVEHFENVIVLINSSSAMELGFLEEMGVGAALWIGGPGSVGLTGVAEALSGEVNPSGRLVDTYAYDLTSSPAYYNAGDFNYLGSEHEATGLSGMFAGDASLYSFVNYQEGIYVGYRYYETAAADGFIHYENVVQYPFGYGLSYTTFEQEMGELSISDGVMSVDVTVTNTGMAAGREVVQIYYTPPYTPGGIEKSHVVLAAFDKTELLESGQSESLTLSWSVEDMSSYDYTEARAYVLEAGDYEIRLMKNSHEEIDSRIYTVEGTMYGRTSDLTAAANLFDDVTSDIAYMSRADWAGTMPTERATDVAITAELMEQIQDLSVADDPDAEPIVVTDHGIKLEEMAGLDYDDPRWETFLEQLTVKDMEYLIGTSGWQNVGLSAIGKPQAIDVDGPAGLNGLINGATGNQYPSEVVMASTWNTELAEEFGRLFGEEAYANGVSGIYAPAMNIHRTPFSGRNFEYYSEDSLLSGKMGAAVVNGSESTNTYTYIKHFALNDQESNAIELCTFVNEQALRELYLRPFEITVKEGETRGVMAAFNRIGTRWTGASKALMTDVLRNEWGFVGLVITDNAMVGDYADSDQAVEAGTDMMLSSFSKKFDTSDTNYTQQNMRNACHNILYVTANSNMFELSRVGVPAWIWILTVADIILLGLIAWGVCGCTKPLPPGALTRKEKRAAKKAQRG